MFQPDVSQFFNAFNTIISHHYVFNQPNTSPKPYNDQVGKGIGEFLHPVFFKTGELIGFKIRSELVKARLNNNEVE